MKKKCILSFIFIITIVLSVGSANAWYFEINNPDRDSTFDIYFNTDVDLGIDNFQLDFRYDTDEMSWDGIFLNTPPEGLTSSFMGPVTEHESGVLINFNAGHLPFVSAAPVSAGETFLGSITFTILDSAIQDGKLDLWYDTESVNMVATIDGDGAYIPLEQLHFGEGLDIGSPVPIPGAIFLLVPAFLGLIGLRRKTA